MTEPTRTDMVRAGYVPQPDDGRSKVPQMRTNSSNACPNSSPAWLWEDGLKCPPGGLTTFGYCGVCWDNGNVPPVWQARATATLARLRREVGINE